MNVETITMPAEDARKKLRAYRSQIHRDVDGQYAAAAAGYEALAKGTPLIELSRVIQAGGIDDQYRPRLAIARADRREVEYIWRHRSPMVFDARLSNGPSPSLRIEVDPGQNLPSKAGWQRWYAKVPMIPADVIPATGQRKNWHILWEVDEWRETRQTAAPSRDPYLLQHIGGDLWAVLAEWDLTDLEMAVMRGAVVR